jgi:hypothetical protein
MQRSPKDIPLISSTAWGRADFGTAGDAGKNEQYRDRYGQTDRESRHDSPVCVRPLYKIKNDQVVTTARLSKPEMIKGRNSPGHRQCDRKPQINQVIEDRKFIFKHFKSIP